MLVSDSVESSPEYGRQGLLAMFIGGQSDGQIETVGAFRLPDLSKSAILESGSRDRIERTSEGERL